MHDALNLLGPVWQALQESPAPLSVFVRDDDAGWDDPALTALLDCCAQAGVPLDLAVIPMAISRKLATHLCERIDAAPALLGVHQHGYAHNNHETVGRRCEFGSSRSAPAQRNDLRQGRARLQSLFGHRLDDIFTPPWNRCAAYTPGLLAELGFAALSRDRTAPAQQDLPELGVDVDWCKHSGGAACNASALARALTEAVCRRQHNAQPLGLMLHHAQMSPAELELLSHWLPALRAHPKLRWLSMREALAEHGCALQ
jgi:hypothetical protein